MAFCVSCGKQVPQTVSFCPYCGRDLRMWKHLWEQQVPSEQQNVKQAPEQQVPSEQTAPQTVTEQAAAQPMTEQTAPKPLTEQTPEQTEPAPVIYSPVASAPAAAQEKPTSVPGKSLGIFGRVLSIVGFSVAVLYLILIGLWMAALMAMDNVYVYWNSYGSDLLLSLFFCTVQAAVFSVAGLLLTRGAERKGYEKTKTGKLFGALGTVCAALALTLLALCLIVAIFA